MKFQPGNQEAHKARRYLVKVEDLQRMRDAGLGPCAIAKVYGCDQSTARSWLKRFNLATRLATAPDQAVIERAIASAEARRKRRLSAYPEALG